MATSRQGFTFIEVLIAMMIFVLAVISGMELTSGAVKATRDTRDVTVATWLLQNVMTELETKLETEGIEKGCEKKKEAKFEAPHDNFSWVTYCTEINFRLSESAAQLAQATGEKEDENKSSKENMIQKMILESASQYLTKSIRELHAEVIWTQGKNTRRISATTHFARYDTPMTLPSLSIGGS